MKFGIDSINLCLKSEFIEHTTNANAHHTKTTSFAELTDNATDAQIPNEITINYAITSGNADTVDGKHATEFGDGHSLDAADGNPVNAVYVDNGGYVGINTTQPDRPLTIMGRVFPGTVSHQWISFKESSGTTKWHINYLENRGFCIAETGVGSHLFIEKTSGNVGIGTTDPLDLFNVVWKEGKNGAAYFETYADEAGQTQIILRFARGYHAAPFIVKNEDLVACIKAMGHNGYSFSDLGSIKFYVDGIPSEGTSLPGRIDFSTTPGGSVTGQVRMTVKK